MLSLSVLGWLALQMPNILLSKASQHWSWSQRRALVLALVLAAARSFTLEFITLKIQIKRAFVFEESIYSMSIVLAMVFNIKKIGKWIVAQTETQANKLHQLLQAGKTNGIADLQFLSPMAISTGEPSLKAFEVLYSPSTGILNSHAYMQSLVNDIEAGGGVIVYKAPFDQAESTCYGFKIRLGGAEPSIVKAEYLINAAGLYAVKVAQSIQGLAYDQIPEACFAKGSYYAYMGKVPFQRLIYPVPETGGLGIHLTLDMGGQARFGPDVEWIEKIESGKQ